MMARALALPDVATVRAVADVRVRLREWLAGQVERHCIEDVELIATELVTNAILHGGGSAQPRLVLMDDAVRIEVRDHSPELPRTQDPDPDDGRGLRIVASLSRRWGAQPTSDGDKVVWSEVRALPANLLTGG
jgi:anti-sigma regulatory factor (Ser/Thr protein kinase)